MTTPVCCRKCSAEIPSDDVNVKKDIAFCRVCGALSGLSGILLDAEFSEVDVTIPPHGCRIHEDGIETTVTASARSVGKGLGLLVFTVFWNYTLSVFILLALAETIQLLFGFVPSWFPGTPGLSNSNGGTISAGMLIFLWIFLTPFMVVGIVMMGALFTSLFGRVEVRVRPDRGIAFTGIGPLGWKRRFNPREVKDVRTSESKLRIHESEVPNILIKADRTVHLGSILPYERLEWMAVVLRRKLLAQEIKVPR